MLRSRSVHVHCIVEPADNIAEFIEAEEARCNTVAEYETLKKQKEHALHDAP